MLESIPEGELNALWDLEGEEVQELVLNECDCENFEVVRVETDSGNSYLLEITHPFEPRAYFINKGVTLVPDGKPPRANRRGSSFIQHPVVTVGEAIFYDFGSNTTSVTKIVKLRV